MFLFLKPIRGELDQWLRRVSAAIAEGQGLIFNIHMWLTNLQVQVIWCTLLSSAGARHTCDHMQRGRQRNVFTHIKLKRKERNQQVGVCLRPRPHLGRAGWAAGDGSPTQYPIHTGFSVLISATSCFVFVGSWLLGPHAKPSPWLDAEAEKKLDPGKGWGGVGVVEWGEGPLGRRGMPRCPRVGITGMDTETTQALHTIGVACSGDLGVNIFPSQVICAVFRSFEGSLLFPILLPKEASLEQRKMQAGRPSYS